jgi:hypothetical protein
MTTLRNRPSGADIMKGTTEHTEYTESRSAKEPSVCSVYSVVERMFVDANERVGEPGEVQR